jgi:hypothetical protein
MSIFRRVAATALLVGFASGASASGGNGFDAYKFLDGPRFTVDVAMDGATWRFDDGSNPFYPTFTGELARGKTFIVSGNIYKGSTLEEGGDFGGASNPAGPGTPEPIGTWVCRGTFNFDIGDIANGAAPHVTSTQFFYFNDGTLLVTDGPEGGAQTLRAVIGGAGKHASPSGESVETPLGVNDSNLFNVRFRFRLK